MNKNDVSELIKLFTMSGLTSMEYESDGARLRLENGRIAGADAGIGSNRGCDPGVRGPADGGSDGSTAANAFEEELVTGEYVKAPLVGTFYRAPAEDAEPFAGQGAVVEAGETICIIEAMKVMNEIPAPYRCQILRVLVADGAMTEFGEPLFEIRKC